MNEIPAGAGNDDPRRRLGTADGVTNLIETGLSSFLGSATVYLTFPAEGKTADIRASNAETSLCVVSAESNPLENLPSYV